MKIYHNSRCSKSRDSYNLLKEKGVDFETIEYLKNPLTETELTKLLAKLNIPAEDLIRKGEPTYKENFKGKKLSETEWIAAMVKFPKLIERPIIVKGNKAVIGRPIEKVIELLGE
ncbi:arsenate reductase (glutaredoxin) [Arcticibacterium luteifluviistationis]|uniref:Arsenate reductase (Glutaredoxin) n=1 Tax=Arcticibacterium luteifluviistationis TaxID=1784714 RepID=A0A2Z4GAD7_9BACT|nr:arsenate reductase (glutaredoxin) [Arcticibacterium luteifluviistationis]AWV98167.1 arsenate reductase (glutaredoxin) [Arcticibacterium luteifluviistationis]